MKFLYYDLGFLALFAIIFLLFFYLKRKNWTREGIMFLYKTQLGVKLIDYFGERFKKHRKGLGYLVITIGYVLMVSMLFLLGQLAYVFFSRPDIVRAIKIPPLMPLIPYIPSVFKLDFLPPFYFTYWIIAIAIIAVSHEISHGIFAKFHDIKVKATGFGFLGPFLAAFVEPDEKQMQKSSKFAQLSILGAGSFANVIMTILFFLIMFLFFSSMYSPAGAMFTDYSYVYAPFSAVIGGVITEGFLLDGVNLKQVNIEDKNYFVWEGFINGSSEVEGDSLIKAYDDFPAIQAELKGTIIGIGGEEIKTRDDLGNVLLKYNPGDEVNIQTRLDKEIINYEIVLGENPVEEGKAFLGIGFSGGRRKGVMGSVVKFLTFFKKDGTEYLPRFGGNNGNIIIFIYDLLWWIVLINISVALFNLLPVGIFDGGRFFYLTVLGITGRENIAKKSFKIVTGIILLVFVLLMVFWYLGIR